MIGVADCKRHRLRVTLLALCGEGSVGATTRTANRAQLHKPTEVLLGHLLLNSVR